MSSSLVFVHDHKFLKCENTGAIGSPGRKFSSESFRAYDSFGMNIVVLARCRAVDSLGFDPIDLPNIDFRFIEGRSFIAAFSWRVFSNLILMFEVVRPARVVVLRLPSVLGVVAGSICLLFHRPYFVEQVGDPKEALVPALGKNSFFTRTFAAWFSFLNAWLARRATGVIYVTDHTLQQRFPCPGLQGAASNVVVDVPAECPKRVFFGMESTGRAFRMGSIGSYANSYKGYLHAIDAVAVLCSAGFNASLEIVGAGDRGLYISRAEQLGVRNQISFLGEVHDHRDLFRWLDELDVYIQPSLTEGLPRALIEAMSRGLPCVATRVGGIPELLADDCLAPPGDGNALAAVIRRVCETSDAARHHGELNHVRARSFDSVILARKKAEFWRAAAAAIVGNGASSAGRHRL